MPYKATESERDNEALARFTSKGDISLMGLYKATKNNLTMCGRILGHSRMTINRVFYGGCHSAIVIDKTGNLILLAQVQKPGGVSK